MIVHLVWKWESLSSLARNNWAGLTTQKCCLLSLLCRVWKLSAFLANPQVFFFLFAITQGTNMPLDDSFFNKTPGFYYISPPDVSPEFH